MLIQREILQQRGYSVPMAARSKLPVEGVVDVGKYMQEVNRVELSETVPDGVHAGKYQVDAARSRNTSSWHNLTLSSSSPK